MPLSQGVRSLVRVVLVIVVFVVGPGIASAQDHYEGVIGPGALYEIDVPAVWNGDLVLYAHGIVQASLPVALARQPGRVCHHPHSAARRGPGRRGVELLEQWMVARRCGPQDSSARRHFRVASREATAHVPHGPFDGRSRDCEAGRALSTTVRWGTRDVRAARRRSRGTAVRRQRPRHVRSLLSGRPAGNSVRCATGHAVPLTARPGWPERAVHLRRSRRSVQILPRHCNGRPRRGCRSSTRPSLGARRSM